MKKLIYFTLAVFIIILIIVAIIASKNAPNMVEYRDGKIVQLNK